MDSEAYPAPGAAQSMLKALLGFQQGWTAFEGLLETPTGHLPLFVGLWCSHRFRSKTAEVPGQQGKCSKQLLRRLVDDSKQRKACDETWSTWTLKLPIQMGYHPIILGVKRSNPFFQGFFCGFRYVPSGHRMDGFFPRGSFWRPTLAQATARTLGQKTISQSPGS